MTSKTDGRGRIYLPAEIREEFGDEYRIVKLPSRVTLLPIDDDPIDGLREAVGDAFEDADHDQLESEARAKARSALDEEIEERDRQRGE